MYLAKLDAAGTHVWSKRLADWLAPRPMALSFDPAGNLYMAAGGWPRCWVLSSSPAIPLRTLAVAVTPPPGVAW